MTVAASVARESGFEKSVAMAVAIVYYAGVVQCGSVNRQFQVTQTVRNPRIPRRIISAEGVK